VVTGGTKQRMPSCLWLWFDGTNSGCHLVCGCGLIELIVVLHCSHDYDNDATTSSHSFFSFAPLSDANNLVLQVVAVDVARPKSSLRLIAVAPTHLPLRTNAIKPLWHWYFR